MKYKSCLQFGDVYLENVMVKEVLFTRNDKRSDGQNLKGKVMSGLVWTFGERIIAQGISFIISIILARILMPAEYGVVSLITIFITIADVFVSNGFGEALVKKVDSDETDFSTVFYCSFSLAWVLYIILFFSADLVADFYSSPILSPLLKVLSLKLPISAISTIQHAYVSKHMIFKRFFFSTLGGTFFSGIIGVTMAMMGAGPWALVAQYLVNTTVDTIVLFFIVPWRPKFLFSLRAAKSLVGYGWKLTVSSLINTVYGQLRSLIIGRMYSSEDLAYYNKGNQFPSLIINNVDTSIGKVVFPAMTKVASKEERLKAVGRRAMMTTSYIIFPLMGGLFAVATPLVRLLLTDKWLFCVPYLQCCCVYYMCQPIQTTNWQIMKALGRSDLCLKLEILKKCIGILIILLSMGYGVLAIAIGNAIFAVISMIINAIPNKKLIDYSIKEQARDLFPALFLSSIMVVFVMFVTSFLRLPSLVVLAVDIFLGGAFYICCSWIFKIDSFIYLIGTVKPILKKIIKR